MKSHHPQTKLMRRALLGGLPLLLALGACKGPASTFPPSTDPEINKVKFSQVSEASANTSEYTAGLVNSSLTNALNQDFLTINATPSNSTQGRLFSVILRTPANQIKVGASFPLGTENKVGVASAVYRETRSIIISEAYRATAGEIIIDAIDGTLTQTFVEFHIKDAKMMPDTSSNLSKGSFVINMHGIPANNN